MPGIFQNSGKVNDYGSVYPPSLQKDEYIESDDEEYNDKKLENLFK